MNRREAIFGLIKSAGFLMAAPALGFEGENADRPYGADCLENTDPQKLSASIASQLLKAGLSLPVTFELFPGEDWPTAPNPAEQKQAGPEDLFTPLLSLFFGGLNLNLKRLNDDEYSTPKEIVGTSKQNTDLSDYKDFFRENFRRQPPCNGFGLSQAAWNADTAFHETIHYILFNLNSRGQPRRKGEPSLGDYVFSVINKTRPQDPDLYIASLRASLKNHPLDHRLLDRLAVAEATQCQIHERIADSGAALYALSNYTNLPSVSGYYETLADIRKADFTDDEHRTTTSIRAALQAFMKNPRRGLPIDRATIWAANIIMKQPEFQRSIADMAREIRDIQHVEERLEKHKPARGAIRMDEVKRDEIYRSIVSARNHACGVFDLSMR